MSRTQDRRQTFWGRALGVVLTIGLGLILTRGVGNGLTRLSYDLPFVFGQRAPDELVMVYLDGATKRALQQPADLPLRRDFHARLLDRVKADGARLVVFDFTFDQPSEVPGADEVFADAIRRNGPVVLMIDEIDQLQSNVGGQALVLPVPVLARATTNLGLARLATPDADSSIRQIDTGSRDVPSASWAAAVALGASSTRPGSERMGLRWFNFYGPTVYFLAVDYDQVVSPDILKPGTFRDKIVVVGARPAVSSKAVAREEWPTPHSRWGHRFSYGAEFHALSLINLLHDDWLTRLGEGWELILIVAWGAGLGLVLGSLRPWTAGAVAVGAVSLLTAGSVYVQFFHRVWWPWMIPAVGQTSIALIWSVGYQYFVASRHRRKLRDAFGAYLSPYMADKIAESEMDLSLGGVEVEATVMFTDLEGFTKMSETLQPQEVSKILTTYFNHTTRGILEEEGTIIKYIGDAVMAVWGAPLPDPRQADRAVLAAWRMHQAGLEEIAGRHLRTRIGINSGLVLAGNLGSDYRFDYTLIGDTTNFASRLEGLNKPLGTDVLISDTTRQRLGGGWRLRALGQFRVVGKKTPVGIHEVLGLISESPDEPPWLADFSAGLAAFTRGDFGEAERQFCRAIERRGGTDGPSLFYLEEIKALAAHPPDLTNWDGSVTVHSK